MARPQRQRTTVDAFETEVSPADAERRLRESDDAMVAATAERVLYYPYRLFTFDLHAEALLNELDDTVYCAVDLCNGDELFVDDLPTVAERRVETDAVVPTGDLDADPEGIARRYLLEMARKHLRVGSAPDLSVAADRRVYRPFHLVECETADGVFLSYIVDGLTGDFHRVYA